MRCEQAKKSGRNSMTIYERDVRKSDFLQNSRQRRFAMDTEIIMRKSPISSG